MYELPRTNLVLGKHQSIHVGTSQLRANAVIAPIRRPSSLAVARSRAWVSHLGHMAWQWPPWYACAFYGSSFLHRSGCRAATGVGILVIRDVKSLEEMVRSLAQGSALPANELCRPMQHRNALVTRLLDGVRRHGLDDRAYHPRGSSTTRPHPAPR